MELAAELFDEADVTLAASLRTIPLNERMMLTQTRNRRMLREYRAKCIFLDPQVIFALHRAKRACEDCSSFYETIKCSFVRINEAEASPALFDVELFISYPPFLCLLKRVPRTARTKRPAVCKIVLVVASTAKVSRSTRTVIKM